MAKRKTGDEIIYSLKRDLYYSYGMVFETPEEFSRPWDDPRVRGLSPSGTGPHGAIEAVEMLERNLTGRPPYKPYRPNTAKRKTAKPAPSTPDR